MNMSCISLEFAQKNPGRCISNDNTHVPNIVMRANAKREDFVHQMREREMGCERRFANVLQLISRPNESSAIITTSAGQTNIGKMMSHIQWFCPCFESGGINQMESAATIANAKLGSNKRISLRRYAFMTSSWQCGSKRQKFPPASAIRSATLRADTFLTLR